MILKICKWESKGLRCPDGIVDLKNKGYKKFNFIQMPNFTGKTTYIELIQKALTGSLLKAKGEEILEYRDLKKPDNGFFKLEFEIDSQNIIFEIKFKFVDEANSSVEYFTTTSDEGGELPGYKPTRNVRKFLNEEFVKLFVFNGETASELLNPTKSKAFECIDALCHLNIFDNMQKSLDDYFDSRVDLSKTSAKTKQGITNARNKYKEYEKRINDIIQQKDKAETDLKRIEKEINYLSKVISSDTSLEDVNKKEVDDRLNKVTILESEYKKVSEQYLQIVKNPINLHETFLNSLDNLQKNLFKLRIPASVTRAFFDELTEQPNCICDRDMNKVAVTAINTNKVKYFDDEKAGVYNQLKSNIKDQIQAKDFDKKTLIRKDEEFRKLVDQLDEAKTDLDAAREKLKMTATGDLKKIISKQEKLNLQKEEILRNIEKINNDTTTNLATTMNIVTLKKEKDKEDAKIQAIEKNRILREDTDKIKQLCKYAKSESKQELKKSIIEQCNNEIKNVLKAEIPLQIEDIDGNIKLEGQSGASEGQKLATGIIYLSVLLARENYSFATIFDSPCGAIDLHVRSDLAGAITELVKEEGQFITFVQGSERAFFTETIENLVNNNKINHITILKKGRFSDADLPKLPNTGVTETGNAYFINNKEYFNKFNPNQNKGIVTDV